MPTPAPTLTAAPPSPDRADRGTFAARAVALDDWTKLHQVPELQASIDNVYANAVEVANAAVTATGLVELASAAANYVGPWSAQTGALSRPASVSHYGNYWALNVDLADVTIEVPGVSSAWSALAIGAGGAGVVSSAVDVTLVAASYRLQAIAMTAADKSVALPSATTMMAGTELFTLRNTGDYSFAVRDAIGGLVVVLDPGRGAAVHLVNNSTPAGVWLPSGDSDVLSAFYQNIALAVTAVASDFAEVVAMSPVQAIAVYVVAGTPTAVTLNISGTSVTAGTPVAAPTAHNATPIRIVRLSATQAMLAYTAITTGYPTAVTLNVAGTSITAGAALTVNTVAAGFLSLTMLTATQAVLAYAGATAYGEVRTLNVAGTTITAGAAAVVTAAAVTPGVVVGISATQAVCGFVASGVYLYTYLLTISGTAIAAGTQQALAAFSASPISGCALSPTRVLITGGAFTPANTPRTVLLDVSGATISTLAIKDVAGAYAGVLGSLATVSPTKALHLTSLLGGNNAAPGAAKAMLRSLRIGDDDLMTGELRSIKNSHVYAPKAASLALLTPTLAVVAYNDSNGYLQARVLEIPA